MQENVYLKKLAIKKKKEVEERRQREERFGRKPYDRNDRGGSSDRPKRDFKQYTPRTEKPVETSAAVEAKPVVEAVKTEVKE